MEIFFLSLIIHSYCSDVMSLKNAHISSMIDFKNLKEEKYINNFIIDNCIFSNCVIDQLRGAIDINKGTAAVMIVETRFTNIVSENGIISISSKSVEMENVIGCECTGSVHIFSTLSLSDTLLIRNCLIKKMNQRKNNENKNVKNCDTLSIMKTQQMTKVSVSNLNISGIVSESKNSGMSIQSKEENDLQSEVNFANFRKNMGISLLFCDAAVIFRNSIITDNYSPIKAPYLIKTNREVVFQQCKIEKNINFELVFNEKSEKKIQILNCQISIHLNSQSNQTNTKPFPPSQTAMSPDDGNETIKATSRKATLGNEAIIGIALGMSLTILVLFVGCFIYQCKNNRLFSVGIQAARNKSTDTNNSGIETNEDDSESSISIVDANGERKHIKLQGDAINIHYGEECDETNDIEEGGNINKDKNRSGNGNDESSKCKSGEKRNEKKMKYREVVILSKKLPLCPPEMIEGVIVQGENPYSKPNGVVEMY